MPEPETPSDPAPASDATQPTDASPPAEASAAKTKKRAKAKGNDLAAERKACERLGDMIKGATKLHTLFLFRGPLDLPQVQAAVARFAGAQSGVRGGRTSRKHAAESRRLAGTQARIIVSAVTGYAEVYYDFGAVGGAAFYPATTVGATLADELRAVIAGLKLDRAAESPLLPTAEEDAVTDIADAEQVLHTLELKSDEVETATDATSGQLDQRAVAGRTLRAYAKSAEKAIRTRHRHEPELLSAYGLRIRRFPPLAATLGAAKVAAPKKGAKGGK